MRDYERNERFMCADCGHDCRAMGERYMLLHNLWHRIVMADRSVLVNMLCVGCAEHRLGRQLVRDDFLECTQWADWEYSLRLRRAMHRYANPQPLLDPQPMKENTQ